MRNEGRQMVAMAVTIIGGFAASVGVPVIVSGTWILVGLTLQWIALRPVLREWRRMVGPGKHRAD